MIFGPLRYWIQIFDFGGWVTLLTTNEKERAAKIAEFHLKGGDTVRVLDSWLLN